MVMIDVTYMGDLRTKAVHQPSGAGLVTDAPVDNHGKGEAFSPTDLVATALGSCMLTIIGIVAARHDWNIEGATASIEKTMAAALSLNSANSRYNNQNMNTNPKRFNKNQN